MQTFARSIIIFIAVVVLGSSATLATGPMLPQSYTSETPVSGWWMSEKLDGVRGYWDGSRLYSRNGIRLAPPPEFIAGLPPFPLEGELWGGRGTFEQTSAIVMRHQPHAGWRQLRFAIFDAPAAPGPFRVRILAAGTWFADHPSDYAFVIAQRPVADHETIRQELDRIVLQGGEGLIVRDPEAHYQAGRSAHIVKVKRFSDGEATVIGHLPGKGRNSGRTGALLVRTAEGREFRIGSGLSDPDRDHPPPVGTVITYRYHGHYQSGLPKFPFFLRIRQDQGL